jgi:hypothetical protein
MRCGLLAAAVLGLTLAACTGDDDGERKRAEAAAWCEVTSRVDGYFDETDGTRGLSGVITYDEAADWADAAPKDIRASTERAARILRQPAHQPRPPELADAREEIGAYAAEYCASPARCLADVEGNPRLPCIHKIEARRRR